MFMGYDSAMELVVGTSIPRPRPPRSQSPRNRVFVYVETSDSERDVSETGREEASKVKKKVRFDDSANVTSSIVKGAGKVNKTTITSNAKGESANESDRSDSECESCKEQRKNANIDRQRSSETKKASQQGIRTQIQRNENRHNYNNHQNEQTRNNHNHQKCQEKEENNKQGQGNDRKFHQQYRQDSHHFQKRSQNQSYCHNKSNKLLPQARNKHSIDIGHFVKSMVSRIIQPSRAEVVLREDVIEYPSDPRPNAFFDTKTSVLRVYHGPMYGNPFATLVPLSANPLPIGSFPPQASQFGGFPPVQSSMPQHYHHSPPKYQGGGPTGEDAPANSTFNDNRYRGSDNANGNTMTGTWMNRDDRQNATSDSGWNVTSKQGQSPGSGWNNNNNNRSLNPGDSAWNDNNNESNSSNKERKFGNNHANNWSSGRNDDRNPKNTDFNQNSKSQGWGSNHKPSHDESTSRWEREHDAANSGWDEDKNQSSNSHGGSGWNDNNQTLNSNNNNGNDRPPNTDSSHDVRKNNTFNSNSGADWDSSNNQENNNPENVWGEPSNSISWGNAAAAQSTNPKKSPKGSNNYVSGGDQGKNDGSLDQNDWNGGNNNHDSGGSGRWNDGNNSGENDWNSGNGNSASCENNWNDYGHQTETGFSGGGWAGDGTGQTSGSAW